MSRDELVSSTYFFVSSNNADDSPNNAVIRLLIPDAVLYCRPEEYMIMTMEQHTMLNQLYNVTSGNISYVINEAAAVPVILPSGSYTFCQLQKELNNLLIPGVRFLFSDVTNKWTVTNNSNDAVTITTSPDIQRLLGLVGPLILPASPNGTVVSSKQAVPTLYTELLFSLEEVSVAPLNLTNVGLDPEPDNRKQRVRNTNVMGIIPVTADPGTLNNWINLNNTFAVRLFGDNISAMQFVTTDVTGQLVFDLPAWTATFKVQVFRRPEESAEAKRLAAIEEFTRLQFLLAIATSKLDVQPGDLFVNSDQIIDPRLTPAEQQAVIETVMNSS
jgi:hypothetical protein